MPLTTASTTGADNRTSGSLNKSSLCVFLGGKEKPLGKSTINDWMKEKGFPKPIRLSQTLALWRVSEVVQWVEARASANDDYLEEAKIRGLEISRAEIAHLKNTISLTLGFQETAERENFIKEVYKDTQELLTWIEQKSEGGLSKKTSRKDPK